MNAGYPRTRELAQVVFHSLRGDLLEVRCQAPQPPGTRVTIPLPHSGDDEEMLLTGKVVRVTPRSGGASQLAVRLSSCTREQRRSLEELIRVER